MKKQLKAIIKLEGNSIIVNTALRWSGEIVNKVMWFLFVIVLARDIGASEFGVFNYAFAFASLLVTFTDLGTNIFTTQAVAKDNGTAGYYLANFTGIKVLLSLLVFGCAVILPKANGQTASIVLLFTLALIVSAFLDTINAIYRAHKQMYLETLVMLVWRVLLVVVSIAGMRFLGFKLPGIAIAFIVTSVIAVAVSEWVVKKRYRISLLAVKQMMPAAWPGLIARSLPLGILIIISGIFYKLNVIILQYFADPSEVGWYGAAFKLIEGTLFVPAIFIGSLFPHLCEANSGGRISQEGFRLFKKATLFLLVISIAAGIGVSVFGKDVILVLYGRQFLPAADALRVLTWGLVFIYLNEFFLFLFLSVNRQKSVLKIMGILAVIYILLCVILIPYQGFIGAAWVLFWTQCALFCFNLLLLRKTI